MPIYTLRDKETQEIFERTMKISEYEVFMEENPNFERYYNTMPLIGDSVRLGIKKPPSDFQKNIIGRMKDSIPGNTLGDRKFSIPKEF